MTVTFDRRQLVLTAMAPYLALALLNHHYNHPLLALHPGWFWLADVIQFVVVPVLAWRLWLVPARITPAELGLAKLPAHDLGHGLAAIGFGAVGLALWYWPVHLLVGQLWWQYSPPPTLQPAMPTEGVLRWLVAAYCALTAGLIEEVVFRALPWIWLQGRLRGRWGPAAYVWLTSLVFAAVHSEQGLPGVVASLWFGVLAARAFVRHRNLWPLVLGHFLIDLVIFAP